MLVESSIQWFFGRADTLNTLLVFVGVLCTARLAQWYQQLKSLPPGPWGLPLFGYLPFMKNVDAHVRFGELAKKYGSIISTRLGTQLVVVLSDYKIIRETFKREEFTGRPHTEFFNILGGYGESFLINPAPELSRIV